MADSGDITREQFASLALNLASAYNTKAWTVDFNQFALLANDQDGLTTLALGRLFQDYLEGASPENLLTLQRHLRLLLNPVPLPTTQAGLLECLLPCLRSLTDFQRMNLQALAMPAASNAAGMVDITAPSRELVFSPYADILAVGLVFNKPETVQHARYFELAEAGINIDQAFDRAVQNLLQISQEPMRPVHRGFYTSPWKDFHDGARLLLPHLFAKLAVDGGVVALSPAPDALFITGSKDYLGLQLMTALGRSLMQGARAVAALPLILRNDVWESFLPDVDDPVYDLINSYRHNVLRISYENQSPLLALSPAVAKGGTIAPYVLENDKHRGFIFSKTNVLEGSVNIMPQTDIVEFFKKNWAGKNQCVARAPFAKIQQVMPDNLFKDPKLEPPRWYINTFPEADQIKQIGLMPAEQSPLISKNADYIMQGMALIESILLMPVPPTAQLDGQFISTNNRTVQNFVCTGTVADLQNFYRQKLPIGTFDKLPTEQGVFYAAVIEAAHCRREILFGPNIKAGETLLRLIISTDYNTLAVRNALIKQQEPLTSLEQFFGISLPEGARLLGDFQSADTYGKQSFIAQNTPEQLVQFFKTQMLGPEPAYLDSDGSTPHVMTDNSTTIVIGIEPLVKKEGVRFTISRDWKIFAK